MADIYLYETSADNDVVLRDSGAPPPAPPPEGTMDSTKISLSRTVTFVGGIRTVVFTGGIRTVRF